MPTINLFQFNKIYVIESLFDNDKKTGQELYNDIIVRCCTRKDKVKHELLLPNSKQLFFSHLNQIIENIERNREKPIIHFEIHGSKQGFVLSSNELVSWEEIKSYLIKINYLIGNHLFITSAVCFGGYISSILTMLEPSPFFGLIGTFGEITHEEHFDSFQEFFQDLLINFNLTHALRSFKNANVSSYRKYYSLFTDEIFINAYTQYVKTNQSPIFTKKRAKEAIADKIKISPLSGNRHQRRVQQKEMEKQFIQTLKERRNQFYLKTATKFFMLDKFPENLERFNIPKSYSDMLNGTSIMAKTGMQDI